MPQTDPLERIMGMLRGKGAIDPAQSQERMARMKPQRRQMGAAPPEQRRETPAPEGRPLRDRASPEEGTEGEMTAPGTTIPVIIDALNESIIALKVEIHRSPDSDKRRELEGHANRLREQITALGGEPVYADETVEEGLQKLGGRRVREEPGAGGMPQQGMGMPQQGMGMPQQGMPQQGMGGIPGLGGLQQMGQTRGYIAEPLMRDIGAELGIDVGWDPEQHRATVAGRTFDPGTVPHTRFDPETGQHYVEDQAAFQREFAPERYVPEEGFPVTEAEDDLTKTIQELAAPPEPARAPAPTLTPEYVNRLLGQYGLAPRSQEEIQSHAEAIVARQAWKKEQVVQRELERFEREHPHEFERAQGKIREAAAEMSAERQEEFASRGMYYSTVMANTITDIDEKTLDAISEIARDAANYVAELRSDMRDIAEWAILEEEVVRRQLETDDRELSERLVNLQTQVAMHGDQYALDAWYREEDINLQRRQQQIQGLQMQIDEAERAGQHLATAYMADHPIVQENLQRMGISPDMFAQMPMDQRAALVTQTAGFAELEGTMRRTEVETQAILADMRLAEERFGLDVRKFGHDVRMDEEGIKQFWAKFGLSERELEHIISIDNQRLDLDRKIRSQQVAQGWASVAVQRERIAADRAASQYERKVHEQALGDEAARDAMLIHDEGLGFVDNYLTDGAWTNIEAAKSRRTELNRMGAYGYARTLDDAIDRATAPAETVEEEQGLQWWTIDPEGFSPPDDPVQDPRYGYGP